MHRCSACEAQSGQSAFVSMQEEQRTEADLADLAASAQLHHQLRILGAALQTAQIDPAHFGLQAKVRQGAYLMARPQDSIARDIK